MKRNNQILNRLFVILLTAMMTLSMTGYTFVEAFTEGEEPVVTEEQQDSDADGNGAVTSGGNENETGNVEGGDTAQGEGTETGVATDATEVTQNAEEPSDPETPEEPAAAIAEIRVRASGDENYITAVWTAVEGADHYQVYLDGDTEGVKVEAGDNAERKHIFSNADPAVTHTVIVEAYRTEEGTEEPVKIGEGSAADIKAVIRGKLSGSPATAARNMGLSLRPMLDEKNSGYAVAQGAATDGTYAYYMMSSSSTQKGRVLKVNLSNPNDYKKGPIINTHHANGMTYDSKRGRLVAVAYGAYRQQVTFIDPNSLTIISQPDLKYSYVDQMEGLHPKAKNNGIAAISYIPKYDVYLARSRGYIDGYSITTSSTGNDLWVFDAESLEAIGHIYTKVSAKYPETYQSMDADEKYAYYLLSPGSGQSGNIILALDWNSENLLPVLNGETKFVSKVWNCNNNGTGEPDAVLRIPISHESEGLFHTTDANGTEHFYVSEYHGRWIYKTVTKKVKYKVKWKKVRKRVKWKKVKRKGKWKWKYKTKKVWKYKTKTKKAKVQEKDYYARDNYVYDLGTF